MAPWIVLAGAGAGVIALLAVLAVFVLQPPPAIAALLYLIFGGVFLASAAIFGRLLVIE